MHEGIHPCYTSPARPWPPSRLLRAVRDDNGPPGASELEQLLRDVASRRDWQAFVLLFQHFGPRLKTFYMRSATSSGVADDLVQETMMSVWRKAAQFDPTRAGVSTWIFTIARNLRIDHMRRLRDPSALPYESVEAPPSQEAIVLGLEGEARVRRAMASLSDEQQTVLQLTYFGEKSQSEIASELGIPLGTVKSRTRLALARLRTILDEEE